MKTLRHNQVKSRLQGHLKANQHQVDGLVEAARELESMERARNWVFVAFWGVVFLIGVLLLLAVTGAFQ